MIAGAMRGATCASCANFPREGLEGEGVAECAMFLQIATHSHPACILYEKASDPEARRVLVMKLKEA